jgi:serine protease
MKLRGYFSVVVLSALLISFITPVANASQTTNSKPISGIILTYAEGVSPIAKNGEPTGANHLRGSLTSQSLGGEIYYLELVPAVDQELANNWLTRLKLDPRIDSAELNFEIEQKAISPTTVRVPVLEKARPASGPRSLVAKPAVSSTTSEQARVRLTWRPPANRYGAKIIGYRIQYSSNGGASYSTLINNTGSNLTRAFVSDGIRAGVSYRFRVRAITSDGSSLDTVGAASNTVTATVKTAPKPVFITSGPLIGPGSATYLTQSISDRGGFAASGIRYRAVATAADVESVETSLCSATRCRFPNLIPDTSYTVEVIATNALGSSSSSDSLTTNDFYFPLQWYLNGRNGISMPTAWKYSQGDGDKVVAVIDTGIKSHQQIDAALTRNADGTIYGYDFVTDLTSAADGDAQDPNPNDEGGDSSSGNSFHGTHVAGIIAAEHDFVGTAGVAPKVKVLPIRALGRSGGELKDLLQAIQWAAGEKLPLIPRNKFPVSVINLSLGAKELAPCSGVLASVIDTTIAKGITVVVAAGNEGRASLSFPANCRGVVTVVATQSLGDRASYSNYGEGSLVSAPGGEFTIGSEEAPESRGGIISSWVDEANLPTYRLSEGTSMAAPVVSGIVALMYSMQPDISPNRVRSILEQSVRPFATGSSCATTGGCGSGIINAQLALARTSVLK